MTSARAWVGGACPADAIHVREGIVHSPVPREAGAGVMLLVRAGCLYCFGVKRLLSSGE